jgi:hypothetical protein
MISLVIYFSAPLFALLAPAWMLVSHAKIQNRLLKRCARLYSAAIEACESNDEKTAREKLARIRRVEARWRLGSGIACQIALGLYVIGVAFLASLALRQFSWTLQDLADGRLTVAPGRLGLFPSDFVMGAGEALCSCAYYWGSLHWSYSMAVGTADWGDRLEQHLNAANSAAPKEEASASGPLSDHLLLHQVFGLGPVFTRAELNRARRRLVKELHPDLCQDAKPSTRCAREDALKRINAAYDSLRSVAAA